MGPSVWGLSEIVQSEKGPTVIGPSVIGQSEILAQADGSQRPWAQIVLGQNEIQAFFHHFFQKLKLLNFCFYVNSNSEKKRPFQKLKTFPKF